MALELASSGVVRTHSRLEPGVETTRGARRSGPAAPPPAPPALRGALLTATGARAAAWRWCRRLVATARARDSRPVDAGAARRSPPVDAAPQVSPGRGGLRELQTPPAPELRELRNRVDVAGRARAVWPRPGQAPRVRGARARRAVPRAARVGRLLRRRDCSVGRRVRRRRVRVPAAPPSAGTARCLRDVFSLDCLRDVFSLRAA